VSQLLPINIKEMKKMLKRYGIEVQELPEVRSVVLSAEGYEIVVKDPQVAVLNVGQQKVIQIICSGLERREKERKPQVEISEEDINFVMEQTGASREEVLEALSKSGGDIAKAILMLQERKASIESRT